MSAALTIAQVRSWRPQQLDAAATTIQRAGEKVEDQATAVRTALEQALVGAGGDWAEVATERAADEARTGRQLADALELARKALRTGSVDIGDVRTRLLDGSPRRRRRVLTSGMTAASRRPWCRP